MLLFGLSIFKEDVIRRLEQTYGATDDKKLFEERLMEIAERIAADYYEELLPDLQYMIEGSFLEGLEEQNVGIRLRETLSDSISFTLFIEKTVYAYVQSQIDEYGLDAQIVDGVVSGSRCRGIEQENSDLDVIVEYTGSTREDDFFNMLHEDSIYIAGIPVDINPITEGRTGTLETYLPEVETYLQEKTQQEQINNQLVTQGREVVQEQNTLVSEEKVHSELEKEPAIEPEPVHITFTVAECGEFHNMGEYHEGIETIEEAMKLYNAIDPSRMHGIPSIGVNMHIEGTEEWEDEQADIVSGKRIDVDFLNYTPELRDTPKVKDAIKKLIAAYPEKDVIDMETKEQKIQTLAAELDQLSQDIDPYGYADTVSDREAQVLMIADDIRNSGGIVGACSAKTGKNE